MLDVALIYSFLTIKSVIWRDFDILLNAVFNVERGKVSCLSYSSQTIGGRAEFDEYANWLKIDIQIDQTAVVQTYHVNGLSFRAFIFHS